MRAALAIAMLLAGCSSPQDDAGRGADEDQMLNEAAAMLDANTVAPPDLRTNGNRS